MKFALLKKIKKDTNFRIKIFLLLSIVFNLLYSIFLFVISQIFFSQWFFIMAIYYGLLSMARIFMFFQIKPQTRRRKKLIIMCASGYFLLLLNLVVSIMMFLLIYTTQYVEHHEITVITLATYTFTTLTISIIGIIKHIKYDDCLYFSIKVVNLISASVSIVTLTNTMLTTFGKGDNALRSIILPILSAFISIFIIFCAILMIIKANKELGVLKMNKNESKYFYTASLMNQALLELLEKKDIEFITITEITKKAGVNRSTFYLHYENIYELLEETINNLNTEFVTTFNENISGEIVTKDKVFLITEEFLVPYLNFCKKNKRILKTVHKNPQLFQNEKAYKKIYDTIFYPAISQFLSSETQKIYYLEFFIQGVLGIIRKWMELDCETEIEELIAIIKNCVGVNAV